MRALTVWVICGACHAAPPADDTDSDCVAADTGPAGDCASVGPLSIGLGVDNFVPLGVEWPLERGPQGLQHVELALRVPVDVGTLAVPRASVTVGAWRLSDHLAVADTFTSGWELAPVADGAQILGVRVVLPRFEEVVDREVGFDVRLVPVGGQLPYHGWARATVRWVVTDTDAP